MKRNTFLFGLAATICVVLTLSGGAATLSTIVASGTYTNLLGLTQGRAVKITQINITATSTNAPILRIYDSPTTNIYYTNAAYSQDASYATNYIQYYTNFFGQTNWTTNLAVVHYTVSNAATTNVYPLRFTAVAPTNTTVSFDGVNYNFINGVFATNAGVGHSTVTITYQ